MKTQSNPLSAVVTELHAVRHIGKYALLRGVMGSLVMRQIVVKIISFNETLTNPWTVKWERGWGSENTGYRSVQSQFPGQDLYLTPVPFENPLAKVGSAKAGQAFRGQAVFMWENGWHPEKKYDQKFVISDYVTNRARHPWWCGTVSNPSGRAWYAQATNMLRSFYIVPVAVFDPKEARTPAESLSRIFLGD